jgi:predicted GNAT family acetyltransferase
MDNIKLDLDEKGRGAFTIAEGDEQIGEMVISIDGANLTVYHTEVDARAEGKGYAKKLLAAMVDHARKNNLKVTALCPYVHAQFKRHAAEYVDIINAQ